MSDSEDKSNQASMKPEIRKTIERALQVQVPIPRPNITKKDDAIHAKMSDGAINEIVQRIKFPVVRRASVTMAISPKQLAMLEKLAAEGKIEKRTRQKNADDDVKVIEDSPPKITNFVRDFECKKCGGFFSNKSILEVHTANGCKVSKKTSFRCDKCYKLFHLKLNFQIHQENCRKDQFLGFCFVCIKKFVGELNLFQHFKKAHGERYFDEKSSKISDAPIEISESSEESPQISPQESPSTSPKKTDFLHEQSENNSMCLDELLSEENNNKIQLTDKRYECVQCFKGFLTASDFNSHFDFCPLNFDRTKILGENFATGSCNSNDNLDDPIYNQNLNDKATGEIEECIKQIPNSEDQSSITNEVSEGAKDLCNFNLTPDEVNQIELFCRHSIFDTVIFKDEYVLSQTEESKAEKENIKKVKPIFACQTCKHVFKVELSLKIHEKTCPKNPRQCPECEEIFPRMAKMIKHFKTDHKSCKLFQCKNCPKQFRTGYHRNSHEIVCISKNPDNNKVMI